MQFGGCHPTDGCQFRSTFKGSKFPYLGANVTFTNGFLALLPFSVQYTGGVPIGVIGATLKDLPQIVMPKAIKGLKFGDEVAAINRTADFLDFLGVKAQVVLLHQGDNSEAGGPDDCHVVAGPATASGECDAEGRRDLHRAQPSAVQLPAHRPRRRTTHGDPGCFVRAAPLGGRPQDQPQDP
jgi:5'-nucleotidase